MQRRHAHVRPTTRRFRYNYLSRTMSVLAVDIGGTNLRSMLFDSKGYRENGGKIVSNAPALRNVERMSDGSLDVSAVTAFLQGCIHAGRVEPATAAAPSDLAAASKIEAIGVSIAGTVDQSRRVVVRAMNLGLVHAELAAAIEQAVGVPVVLETDSFAAGLAEARLGAGQGYDPVLFLTIGTGIGHAVISSGEVVRGARSGASVFGHICVEPDGVECYCGRRGCLCMYASGRGVAALARSTGRIADGVAVSKAAGEGEDWARELIERSDSYLARALSGALSLLNPARVVISGGAFGPDPERFARLQGMVSERVHASVEPIEIVPGEFPETAALVGAGLVAQEIRCRSCGPGTDAQQ
ncbi:MAG: ROK family protein [Spirochaetaceae bacterium]|nr:MAG: ROK family protein [Spirochaetaceae bacterium]